MKFSNTLIHWYLQTKRDLPWRGTTNPYAIWLSKSCFNKLALLKVRLILAFSAAFPVLIWLKPMKKKSVKAVAGTRLLLVLGIFTKQLNT
jgi:A/G-specific adenine glycosylase